ncbi:response regulator [Calothrix sp. 336/3]|uniref:response regulator n=1 Tax=Calothrix sp. 336/3 TaxID=1337936 RepID=UPI000552E89B|nr:response regulator [Calothrix sp. 336/3]AKG22654.1 chemotaxis protein CheY [Calothrix sp. 336/3]
MQFTKILAEFQASTKLQSNGTLNIYNSQGEKWTFYYHLGRIVWATGGKHPFRRWYRHLIKYLSQTNLNTDFLSSQDFSKEIWDYQSLYFLLEQKQIKREQFNDIVENTISELLFDIAYQSYLTSLEFERDSKIILDTPITFTSADISLRNMKKAWQLWTEAGLTQYHPDNAPIIRQPEKLQQQVSHEVYKKFITFMNGKHSLRDISVKINQNLLIVTNSLLTYLLEGYIELVEIPDILISLPHKNNGKNLVIEDNKTHSFRGISRNNPIIACIDDSPQICQTLQQIVINNGMQFLKIQDSIQALPLLIQHQPDLIFLDLMMPIASGYEICTQIRRISNFTHTPIIILTSNDGIVDRVRSKVVGATEYLTKPINSEKLMSTIYKYLHKSQMDKKIVNLP